MTVPKLASHDARAANNAWRAILKPDGSEYQVFGSESYVAFIQSVRGLRDNVAALDVQVNGQDGIKKHLDRIDEREAAHHSAQAARLAAIEAQLEDSPFPA